uniref:Ig-like domain-containing protein n=1 Tax=Loxodonta africana TaxID=9785 RepID=G3UMT2_LOXAF
MALQIPRGLWTAGVMVMLTLLCTLKAEGRDSPQDFVVQSKAMCYFTNRMERLLVGRSIYNREEIVRFDSDVGNRGAHALGRPDAEYGNSQKDLWSGVGLCGRAEQTQLPDRMCKIVAPEVTISPAKTETVNHHNLLVFSVTDFYPGQVNVRWFRNDQEETAGIMYTFIRNGDWTFQILVMLEMTPQSGDVYTCHVESPSLQSPIVVEWRAQSESAQSRMLSGVGGFVLGLVFLGLGPSITGARKLSFVGPHGPLLTGNKS